jgi:hypothetical protein
MHRESSRRDLNSARWCVVLRGVILDEAIPPAVFGAGFRTGARRGCRALFSSVGMLEILKKVITNSHLFSRWARVLGI